MPIGIGGLAAITAGNSLLNHFIGGQDMQNQQQWNEQQAQNQQQWNQQMQNQQWNQQLSFWHMMNQYNSPQAQMARFKEAGLNPHLIYGQGNAGNAASVQTPDVKGYTRAEASNHIRGLDVFGDFNRFQNIQAQTDNLESQSELASQNALLAAQKTANEVILGRKGQLDYDIARELKDTQVEAAKTALEKAQRDVRKSDLDIEYASRTMTPRVDKIQQDLANAIKDGKLKDLKAQIDAYEVKLNKENLTKGDHIMYRQLKRLKDEMYTPEFKTKFERGTQALRNFPLFPHNMPKMYKRMYKDLPKMRKFYFELFNKLID